MRNQQEFLTAYSRSHRNEANQRIHVICVPVIAFATLGLLWAVPIGRWLGVDAEVATWINPVTLCFVPIAVFYLRLSLAGLVTMCVWYGLSVYGIVLIQEAFGTLALLVLCASLWIGAWLLQFYGHKLEGAKPSFLEDLVFLLIGPLFVADKLLRRAGRKGL